jgi:hypothetical protein
MELGPNRFHVLFPTVTLFKTVFYLHLRNRYINASSDGKSQSGWLVLGPSIESTISRI